MEFQSQFGPWAIVTGATDGLGRAFAHELARRGLNLILTSHNLEKVQKLASEIESEHSVEVKSIEVDLSEPGAVDVLYVRCVDIDVGLVISNATTAHFQSYLESGLEEVRRGIQLNVAAHADLATYFGEAMLVKRKGQGGLLFMSSIVGLQGAPYMSLFSASKAFILNFAEALRYENRNKGIHVTAVAPGPVNATKLKILPESEELFRQYQISVVDPDTLAKGALNALIENKAIYIPGRGMRLRYGFWRQYFRSRSANVAHWGNVVQRYTKTIFPMSFFKP